MKGLQQFLVKLFLDDSHLIDCLCDGGGSYYMLCVVFSAMLDALQRGESEKSWRSDVSKANEKLGKVLSEVEIRSFMDNMLQKNSVEM